jgi:tight adherence protein C
LVIARNTLILALAGFFVPRLWLRMRVSRRQREIVRNFPDALDLLSVSVDAGLAFDSALIRVSEQWSNALTREFNRTIVEMRVGTQRNVALQRMADRTGVQEIQTFVGVLIQSGQLGVSIAETLHTQAAQVRVRRRQRAEELARQASIKMVFALVFFIFPALLVVLLGPGVPRIFEALGNL